MLTRSLIEHSLIYYAKTHKIQASDKYIWERLAPNNVAPVVSKIIDNYLKNLPNYITDPNIAKYFKDLFNKDIPITENLNWIVHRPEEYIMLAKDLYQLPSKGLLTLINFLLK